MDSTRLPVHEHEQDNDPDYQTQHDRFLEPTSRALSFRPNGAWFKHQALNLRDFFIVTWLDWLAFVIIGATAAGVRPPTLMSPQLPSSH